MGEVAKARCPQLFQNWGHKTSAIESLPTVPAAISITDNSTDGILPSWDVNSTIFCIEFMMS